MIKYIKQVVDPVDVADSVICDVCKKKYSFSGEEGMEAQEFQHIRVNGGYGSVFGDGAVWAVDICQHCFKEIMGKYLRDVTPVYSEDLAFKIACDLTEEGRSK